MSWNFFDNIFGGGGTRSNQRNNHRRGNNGTNNFFPDGNLFGQSSQNHHQHHQPRRNGNSGGFFGDFFNAFSNPFSNQGGGFYGPQEDESTFQNFVNSTVEDSEKEEKPTSKNTLKTLPVFLYTPERKRQLKYCGIEDKCSICLDNFKIGKTSICLLPCQHKYCNDCIKPWIEKQNSCPVCRFELPLDDPVEEFYRQKRMISKFSYEGLKIMELNSMVESVFTSVLTAVGSKSKLKPGKKLSTLKKSNSELFQLILKLDTFENFKDFRVKEERKQCIKKIQAMQRIIDDKLKKFTVL